MEAQRIWIFGSTGQIGTVLTQEVKAKFPQAEVIPFSRWAKPGFHAYYEWETLPEPHRIINCVGAIRDGILDAQVVFTRRWMELLETWKHPKVLHISALGAHKYAPSAFLSSKGRMDEELLQFPEVHIARPSVVCLPNGFFRKKLDELLELTRFTAGYLPFTESLKQIRIQPLASVDFCEFVVHWLENPAPAGGISEWVGPEAFSFQQILRLLPTRGNKITPLNFPKDIMDFLVKDFATKCFPQLVTAEEYTLLQQNNVPTGKYPVKTGATDTTPYWESFPTN